MEVHGLICHRDVTTGIICYRSLKQNSWDNIEFILHDDGSLTSKDLEILKANLPIKKIFLKKEADEILADYLSNYPACDSYRKKNPYGIKIFDIPLLEKNEILAYCDSDIFFFKPFKNLFSFPNRETNILLLSSEDEGYCLRPWHFFMYPGLKVISKTNAGMFCVKRKYFDLDLAEWFLSKKWPSKFLYLCDQTFWAVLAAKIGGAIWSSNQIRMPLKKDLAQLDDQYQKPLAFYFIGGLKEYIKKHLS
ncbi:hypothetical protein [Methylacidiphilum caldifontis]|uniref:Glycosyl transferase n=1 Tax=Methylacidiphilum caldifontis TaxID=2795386 RepID=A0A4Y8P855_9BACT|nr:hypothetical protein [Methylacidiphilum caldifontis]TFE66582.1 hypothetical protein A7Q10_02065 [Methylacidiphilum caldifontis]